MYPRKSWEKDHAGGPLGPLDAFVFLIRETPMYSD